MPKKKREWWLRIRLRLVYQKPPEVDCATVLYCAYPTELRPL
jgi:hypothetical protein